jgi:hypothetical protein
MARYSDIDISRRLFFLDLFHGWWERPPHAVSDDDESDDEIEVLQRMNLDGIKPVKAPLWERYPNITMTPTRRSWFFCICILPVLTDAEQWRKSGRTEGSCENNEFLPPRIPWGERLLICLETRVWTFRSQIKGLRRLLRKDIVPFIDIRCSWSISRLSSNF